MEQDTGMVAALSTASQVYLAKHPQLRLTASKKTI